MEEEEMFLKLLETSGPEIACKMIDEMYLNYLLLKEANKWPNHKY